MGPLLQLLLRDTAGILLLQLEMLHKFFIHYSKSHWGGEWERLTEML